MASLQHGYCAGRRRQRPVRLFRVSAHFATRLLVLATLLVCISCSRDSAPPLSTNVAAVPPTAEPVTITWSVWGDAWEDTVNRKVVRAFERDHPGIRVELIHRPWSQYFVYLRDEWQVGRSPDVMFLNYIPSYAALGELEPLDRFVSRDDPQLADFYPELLASFRSGGQLYGLPRDNDTKVIYYNRAHFAAAGIAEPVAGWTWSDLRAAALALNQPDAPRPRHGFGFEPDYWWLVWVWQNGGDVFDHPLTPTAVRLDSPPAVEALQFLQDLIHRDRVTPPVAQLNSDAMSRLFSEGRLSMMFGNHALVPVFTEAQNLTWDIAPLPGAVTRANVAGGAGYVVSRRSPHKDAAWQLVEFLTGRKGQALFAESGVITPARRSVGEDNIFLRQQGYRAGVFLSEGEVVRAVPNFPGVTEMDSLINTSLAPVWRGERTAAEAVAELAPRIQQTLPAQPAPTPAR